MLFRSKDEKKALLEKARIEELKAKKALELQKKKEAEAQKAKEEASKANEPVVNKTSAKEVA